MRKAYYAVRGIGYTLGVAAVLTVLWGRRSESAYADEITQVGYLMIVATLLVFCVSYVLFVMMHNRRGPGPGGKRIIPE